MRDKSVLQQAESLARSLARITAFKPRMNWWHCWATGSGGRPYEECLREFPEDLSEERILLELEAEFGPFSSGHRGFKAKRIPSVKFLSEED